MNNSETSGKAHHTMFYVTNHTCVFNMACVRAFECNQTPFSHRLASTYQKHS